MRIIYPTADGGVAVLTPAEGIESLNDLAVQLVPTGVPYRIVQDGDIPADRSQRDLWTADFTSFDGVGG
ncbi:hypothetical protein AncyloWKF20_07470 [Ancylobacter sp. WKF20]|uniref:hypothetical protein n=1 Tax=Ancylobacter sp. WKF20 TaxID=3039801 RepID=UPI0024341393|nr:hypothetical protein [Ancylobacter sp. WKF20]WGD31648.1 hypothetical protein AncyloWKF20_07470 [Ancylobacter sp. WKF20]